VANGGIIERRKRMLSHYRLQIVNYFDKLVNQLDVQTETLLNEQRLTSEEKERLNETRIKFVERIKQVEAFDLSRLESLDLDELKSMSELEVQQALFSQFCFFIHFNGFNIELDFYNQKLCSVYLGYLVVIDKFLSPSQLEIYKRLLEFHNSKSVLHFLNDFFVLRYDPVKIIS
jgi:hypothetical protein